jgi:hypothetical protein
LAGQYSMLRSVTLPSANHWQLEVARVWFANQFDCLCCRCVVDLDDVRGAVVGSATASDQAANSASMVTWTQEGAMPDRLRINRMHE